MGARRGRPTAVIVLDGEERETLERWARRPKSSQALALRCRIVLGAAEGRYNKDIAAELGCHPATAAKWRSRFAERRLDGLCDDPRPGPPRTIDDATVEAVIVLTLESAPVDATHWSTRSMAKAVGISPSSVHAIWGRSVSSPTSPRISSCPRTRSSSTRSATSWGCTSTPRRRRSCCAWTKRHRSRPWTAPPRSCR